VRSRTTPPTLCPVTYEEAAEQLIADAYQEHGAFVYRTLSYLGVEADQIEDALQDVFVAAFRRVRDFDRDRSMRAWLYGIARRVASQHRRGLGRRRRRMVLVHDADAGPDRASLPDDRVLAGMTVKAMLDRLDDDKRRAFVMSEVEGLSAPEIARAEGANVNTIYARIRAARLRFRRMLDDWAKKAREEGPAS